MRRNPSTDNCRASIRELLLFFDSSTETSAKQSSCINAIAGEELATALLKHYLERFERAKVELFDEPVTIGKRQGSRLDRWIGVTWPRPGKAVLFQAEIKNWNANSKDGLELPIDPSNDQLKGHIEEHWKREWNSKRKTLCKPHVAKVLKKMKRPAVAEKYQRLEPLVIYWNALNPRNRQCRPFFQCRARPRPGHPFKRVRFFSMSLYLRDLRNRGESRVDLNMPATKGRTVTLNRLLHFKTS